MLDETGRLEQAADCLRDAIELCDLQLAPQLQVQLALLLAERSPAEARRVWNECVRDAVARGDHDAHARALVLGSTVAADPAQALVQIDAAAAIDSPWARRADAHRALRAGDLARAIELDEHTIDVARRCGDLRLEAAAAAGLGASRAIAGYGADAIVLLQHAARLALSVADARLSIGVRLELVSLLVEQLELDAAQQECDQLYHDVARWGRQSWLPGVLAQHAAVLIERGEIGRAIELAQRATDCVLDSAVVDVRVRALVRDVHARALREQGADPRDHGPAPAGPVLARVRHALRDARAAAGSDDHARRASVQQVLGAIEGSGSPFVVLATNELQLLAAMPSGEVADQLDRVADRWRRRGFRLQAARVSLAGVAVRAVANASGSVTGERLCLHLDAVRSELAACGALGDVSRARELAARIGAASPAGVPLSYGSLLGSLDLAASRAVVASMSLVQLAASRSIDARADALYLVCSGRVLVAAAADAGGDGCAELADAGDVFGDTTLNGGDAAPRTIRALEATVLATLPTSVMRTLVIEHPSLAVSLLGIAGQRLARANERGARLASWTAQRRLAAELVAHADRYGSEALDGGVVIRRRTAQSDLAVLVGASRELVSRTMTTWRASGILRTRGRTVVLAQPSALEQIAAG